MKTSPSTPPITAADADGRAKPQAAQQLRGAAAGANCCDGPVQQAPAQLDALGQALDPQKLQELEQRVADLNALAELGKVYQGSLQLGAELRGNSGGGGGCGGGLVVREDKILGRGSLAVVHDGNYAGSSVAVKLLPIHSVFAEDSRREASLALCLNHPNIVSVVGVHLVQLEATPYLALVQETANGGDLGWQVEDNDFHCGNGGNCPLDVGLRLALDAARGLSYLHHEVGVVHGDVKSRNLLLFEAEARGEGAGDGTKAYRLKWCDFGISFPAASEPGGVSKTATGTPGFRAPEVAAGQGWGAAADTWAFGVCLWQLFSGQRPIAYDREWRMHMPNPRLLVFEEHVPRALVEVALRCCSDSPGARPEMREVAAWLEAALAEFERRMLEQQQQEQQQQQDEQQQQQEEQVEHFKQEQLREEVEGESEGTSCPAAAWQVEVLIENEDDLQTAEAVQHTLELFEALQGSGSAATAPAAGLLRGCSEAALLRPSSSGGGGLLASGLAGRCRSATAAAAAHAQERGRGGAAAGGARSAPTTPLRPQQQQQQQQWQQQQQQQQQQWQQQQQQQQQPGVAGDPHASGLTDWLTAVTPHALVGAPSPLPGGRLRGGSVSEAAAPAAPPPGSAAAAASLSELRRLMLGAGGRWGGGDPSAGAEPGDGARGVAGVPAAGAGVSTGTSGGGGAGGPSGAGAWQPLRRRSLGACSAALAAVHEEGWEVQGRQLGAGGSAGAGKRAAGSSSARYDQEQQEQEQEQAQEELRARLTEDVLAASQALSKALSALASATPHAVAGGGNVGGGGSAAAAAGLLGSDFEAAARGLAGALAVVLGAALPTVHGSGDQAGQVRPQPAELPLWRQPSGLDAAAAAACATVGVRAGAGGDVGGAGAGEEALLAWGSPDGAVRSGSASSVSGSMMTVRTVMRMPSSRRRSVDVDVGGSGDGGGGGGGGGCGGIATSWPPRVCQLPSMPRVLGAAL